VRRSLAIVTDQVPIKRVFVFEKLFLIALSFHHCSIFTCDCVFVDEVLLLFTMQWSCISDFAKLSFFRLDIFLGHILLQNVVNSRVDRTFGVKIALFCIMLWVTVCLNLNDSITPCVEELTVILGDIHLRLHVFERTCCMNELALWFALPRWRGRDHVVFSVRMVDVVLTAILNVMLTKHRVTTLSGG